MGHEPRERKNPPVLSVVVPTFNEEEVIRETHGRIEKTLALLLRDGRIMDYEVIYVDDGSSDATLSILQELMRENGLVRIISLSGNFGHQSALTAGLRHASGDAVVSLDADLQDPPEVMEEMVELYTAGCEVVYGVRKSREKDGVLKKNSARFFYKIMRSMGVNVVADHGDFRLLSRRALAELNRYSEVNLFLRGLVPLLGFRQCIVKYERDARYAGETKYPLKKMLSFAIEGITSFTYFPLRIAAIGGFIVSFIAAVLTVWAVVSKIMGNVLPGWTSTVLPIYLFGGIQLMFLGIIGEYIGKVYMEVKKRPLYIVSEKYNFEDGVDSGGSK